MSGSMKSARYSEVSIRMKENGQNPTEPFQNFLKGHGNEKTSEFLLIVLLSPFLTRFIEMNTMTS